ncbi:MAG: redox-regulated ATPase YchF [Mycoplasmataceae bacterium]|nr:redox-regulated ATPase YchF [Mycoplasmataceae bacterium]
MALKAGIVGLPNVGKSTLFNAITNSKIEIANYPFATIEPNVGVVSLQDERLDFLAEHFKSKSKVNNTFTFIDIAGLVKGASKGEGLGNKFLSNIREVDLIIHVIRCFENKDIIHVNEKIDAKGDAETINLELIFSDLDVANKRLSKIARKVETVKDKELVIEFNILNKLIADLEKGILIRNMDFFDEEINSYSKSIGLITSKPMIYVANISEEEMTSIDNIESLNELKSFVNPDDLIIPISSKVEYEISEIEDADERKMFMEELGLKESGLNAITIASMELLNLGSFFTAGKEESRAWTFSKGEIVKESAGVIHTDISRGFIAADIYRVEDLIRLGDVNNIKSSGLYRTEGKNYKLIDGDVCFFKFNV